MKLLGALLLAAAMAFGTNANAAEKKTETPEAKPAEVKTETAAPAEPNKTETPTYKPANPEAVIVTVNGNTIKEKDLAPEINKQIGMQMQRMAGMGWPMNNETVAMLADQMRDQIVDMMVEKELIREQLKANKIEIKDADIDARFDEMVKKSGQKLEEVEAMLAKQGATIKDVKEQVGFQLGIEKLYQADASYKAVTDADVNTFYTDNPQYFQQPEKVQASHILIKVDEKADEATKKAAKDKAAEILKKVKAGGDFGTLAKENSDCPSKDRGGDLGLFGRGQMVGPFEQAAFSMKVGDISDIVETQFGYHIIKLTDKKAPKTETLAEATPQITEYLKGQGFNRFMTTYNKDLKDKAKIEWSVEEKARRDQKEKEKKEMMSAQPGQPGAQPTPVPPQPKPEEK